MMTRFYFFVAFVAILFSFQAAYAQGMGQQAPLLISSPAPTAPPPMPPPVSLPEDDSEVTILRDEFAGKYNVSTLQNLSQLYWRLGAFDFDDDEAVGNYLKINDCKIYTEYLNDDLEWKKIVTVMKDYLKKTSPTFPVNFQFVLQLHLGRYDPALGGFPIVDKTGFTEVKRIEVDSIDHSKEICNDSTVAIQDYPRSVTVLLSKPFSLDFVKLDEHVAQAYILRKKSEFSKLEEDEQVERYERDAYLRLRITFSQYHGNLQGQNNELMSILFGNIDGYEVFEDSMQKRLMLSVDLSKKDDPLAPQMSVPAPVTNAAPPASEATGNASSVTP